MLFLALKCPLFGIARQSMFSIPSFRVRRLSEYRAFCCFPVSEANIPIAIWVAALSCIRGNAKSSRERKWLSFFWEKLCLVFRASLSGGAYIDSPWKREAS